jgi:hypothetical protein
MYMGMYVPTPSKKILIIFKTFFHHIACTQQLFHTWRLLQLVNEWLGCMYVGW